MQLKWDLSKIWFEKFCRNVNNPMRLTSVQENDIIENGTKELLDIKVWNSWIFYLKVRQSTVAHRKQFGSTWMNNCCHTIRVNVTETFVYSRTKLSIGDTMSVFCFDFSKRMTRICLVPVSGFKYILKWMRSKLGDWIANSNPTRINDVD